MSMRTGIILVTLIGALPAATNAADLLVVPVLASGEEGVDWYLGPGEREITLIRANQRVQTNIFIRDFAPREVADFTVFPECGDFVANELHTIYNCCCQSFENICCGVDKTRPDYIFANSSITNEGSGDLVCTIPGNVHLDVCATLGVVISGDSGIDQGLNYYIGQQVYDVEENGIGSYELDLDLVITAIKDREARDIPITNVHTGIITVASGACCTPGLCVDAVRLDDCTSSGGVFHPGANCETDGDNDGIADICDSCPFDSTNDSDNDTVCDSFDQCPGSDDLADNDGDGIPNDCDDCPNINNMKFPDCVEVPTTTTWGLFIMALGLMACAKLNTIR